MRPRWRHQIVPVLEVSDALSYFSKHALPLLVELLVILSHLVSNLRGRQELSQRLHRGQITRIFNLQYLLYTHLTASLPIQVLL